MGEDKVPWLVASSVYDTKPVHYLSMLLGWIEWIKVVKKIWNLDTEQWEDVNFICMNFINKYNFTMGPFYISDQLQGNYWIDIWVQNRKWWWTLVFWAIGTLLTNAYVVCRKLLILEGVTPKFLLSNYDFCKDIAVYWINTEKYKEFPSNIILASASNSEFWIHQKHHSIRNKKISISLLSPSDTVSTITVTTPYSSEMQCNNITNSLLSLNRSLKCRLDRCLNHTVVPAKGKAQYQIHKWTAVLRKESNVCYCLACNLMLYTTCNFLFHNEPELVEKKNQWAQKFLGEWKKKDEKSKKQRKICKTILYVVHVWIAKKNMVHI